MIGDFISLIFPEVCIHCKTTLFKGEKQICTNCTSDLPKSVGSNVGFNLLNKFILFPKVTEAHSYLAFSKKGIVQSLLHQLKYEANQDIGIMIGRWFGADLKEAGFKTELILPVPLHISRLRTRGYNQSDLFSEGLSESLGIPWTNQLVKRTKKTLTQTKKGRIERWENVEKIFSVMDHSTINDKDVTIVDDVITTGATLNSCVQAVSDSGARSISVLTIAVANPK
ncbi:MAG: ComF family protein [Bacteroidetes bacterium]|nr:ComF family protein [Bacteroidota bacterium]MDA1118973.1 ComF family protein [Bacteroidota bacterium]